MALKDEQKEHLSYLSAGRAVMMMPGISKAIQVQIDKTDENDTERAPIDDDELRNRIVSYYADVYKKGILPGLEVQNEKPDPDIVRLYLDCLQSTSQLVKDYYMSIHKKVVSKSMLDELNRLKGEYDFELVAKLLCYHCHKKNDLEIHPEIFGYVEDLLNFVIEYGDNIIDFDSKKYSLLDNSKK